MPLKIKNTFEGQSNVFKNLTEIFTNWDNPAMCLNAKCLKVNSNSIVHVKLKTELLHVLLILSHDNN